MDWLFWLLAIPVVGLLILIHEVGHFWAGRWMKVGIDEFGFGYPPRMLKLFEKNGVEYTLNWIPFGGFVRLAGEDDPNVPGGLSSAPAWRRLVVLVAGAAMNLVLAFVLFTGLAMYGRVEVVSDRVGIYRVESGSPAQQAGLQPRDMLLEINGREIDSLEDLQIETTLNRGSTVSLEVDRDGQVFTTELVPRKDPPEGQGSIGIRMSYYEPDVTVQDVVAGSPAEQYGLQAGDRIVAINGQVMRDSLDYEIFIDTHPDETVRLSVQREGQAEPLVINTVNESDYFERYQGWAFGIAYWRTARKTYTLGPGLVQGWRETVDAAALVPRTLAGLIRRSVPVSDISGPVGITFITKEVAQSAGLYGVLSVAAMISVNLGLVNLLPIPALDGGRMLFALLEWIRRGKRISPEREGILHAIFFFLLIAFLVVVTYNDIVRIFTMNGAAP